MPSAAAIVWILLSLIWGTTWIAIKIGLDDLPPISFAAIRFVLAIAIVFAILKVQKIPLPKGREWRLLALTGLLQFAVNYGLVFWGEQHIASGLTAVLQASISLYGLVLAWIFLPHERITATKIVAVGLGIAGVAVVFSDQLHVQTPLGFVASAGILLSGFSASLSAVLVKAKSRAMHPAALLFGQMVCGLPPLLVYGLIVDGNPLAFHWTVKAVAAVLYLSVLGTVAAFWLYYWLLGRLESTQVMLVSVVTPVIAVVVGWIVLDEHLPPLTVIGGLLILSSIALIALRRKA